jgi:nucleotide-binding universal stress UspA family protein
MYETVIWATDGSEGADAALAEALGLAELSRARIVAVHCDQHLNGARAMAWPALADEEDRRAKIRRQVEQLRTAGVEIDLVVRKSHCEAADVVAAIAADVNGGILVCGMHGLGVFSGVYVGSFTQRLLQVAPCPVLAVPERASVAVDEEHEEAEIGV